MDIDSPIIAAYLAGEATGDEQAAVERWRAARPENEQRFRARAQIWDLYGALTPGAATKMATPAASSVSTDAVTPLLRGRGSSSPSGGRWRPAPAWAGLAAAAVLVVTLGLLSLERVRSGGLGVEDVVTGSGEIATVALRDGTVVRLGPDSRLGFRQDNGQRNVYLEGQAYFAVRHGSRIPFRVYTEGGEVTVLGTRFDVQARGPEVRVVVVEGEVEMQAQGQRVSIGASEMASVEGAAGPVVQPVDDVYEATAWIGEFIAYGSTPLSAVAREFEQRFGVRVEIPDSALAARTVTGWFRDQSPVEILASICFVVDARCVHSNSGVRIEHLTALPPDSGRLP